MLNSVDPPNPRQVLQVGKPERQIPLSGNPPPVLAHATCLNAGNPRTVRQRCRRVSLRRRLRTRRAVAPQRTGSP
ncbi:hypothetical protein [Brasilonema sennae]|uniref:hypothetical protein n=1 Tax=Brasilonema sennae TaxID=1397703 RepID=UPI0030D9877A